MTCEILRPTAIFRKRHHATCLSNVLTRTCQIPYRQQLSDSALSLQLLRLQMKNLRSKTAESAVGCNWQLVRFAIARNCTFVYVEQGDVKKTASKGVGFSVGATLPENNLRQFSPFPGLRLEILPTHSEIIPMSFRSSA